MVELIQNYSGIIDVLWYFISYAILGWCTEVTYSAVTKGIFVNRGFLNGPVCPIYGVGVVLVVYLLTPFQNNKVVLFFAAMIVTSVLEWITGFILEKVFHEKWWDYSEVPFNIGGYICLAFSIVWGLACVVVVEMVHPAIIMLVSHFHNVVGVVVLCIMLLAFLADLIVTLCNLIHLQKQLRLFTAISDELHNISEKMGKSIFDNVSKSMKRNEAMKELVAEKKEEFKDGAEALRERIDILSAQGKTIKEKYNHSFFLKRLYRAYPRLKDSLFKAILEEDEKVDEGKN